MSSYLAALSPLPIPYYRPPHYSATTFEPYTIGGMPPDIRARSVTIAGLNADVKILAAAQESLEVVPVKAMFETVIAVSVLVMVRVFSLTPFLRSPSATPSERDGRR